MTDNRLPTLFDPASYQYQDQKGNTYDLSELSRDDLLQVACEAIAMIEEMDAHASKITDMVEKWRSGEVPVRD